MNTNHLARIRGVVALVMLLAGGGGVRAAETAADIVKRIDLSRLEAMRQSDGPALARIFSDEIVFIHSDGRSEGKASYIKAMTAGDTAYTDLKTAEVLARQIAPEVIVLSGAQEMKKRLGPTWSDIKLKFMSVWRNEGGTWRMVAWQSMKPAGNSVVPGMETPNLKNQTPKKSP
ncbi:MAG: nuclear transport factor 2 family protein [Verrucomicrobia bacterium]|nr:nuclear transport factor 2 family protein [Verrucomicrobiota bacterium]